MAKDPTPAESAFADYLPGSAVMANAAQTGWSPCKAEDLKEGDVVRWTGEGTVTRTPSSGLQWVSVKFDGPVANYGCNALTPEILNAGKLERQERPLAVGDRALFPNGGDVTVIAIEGEWAWVRAIPASIPHSARLSDLRRVNET